MNRLRMASLVGLCAGLGLLSGCGNCGNGQLLTSRGFGRTPCCPCAVGEPCCDGPLLEDGAPFQGMPGMTMPGMTMPGVTMPGVTMPGVTMPGVTMPGMTNGNLPPLDQGIPQLVPQPTPLVPQVTPIPQAVPTPAGPVSRSR